MNSTNLTESETLHFICAFSISGQYAPAVRCLIYPLLFCVGWVPFLSSGALTTILTYCGVAAIHIAAMVTHHSKEVLDLDLYPAMYVCVLALIITPPAIMQSKPLRDDSVFAVFTLFVILVWIGVVSFASGAIHHPVPMLCSNSTGPVNINMTNQIGNCISNCATFTLPLRSGQTPQNAVYKDFFFKHKNRLTVTITVLSSLWVCFGFLNSRGPTYSETIHEKTDRMAKSTCGPPRPVGMSREGANGLRLKTTFVLAFVWIWEGEKLLKKLPYSENSDAIGQWGPVVAFLLVAVSAVLQLNAQTKPGELESKVKHAGTSEGGSTTGGGGEGVLPVVETSVRGEMERRVNEPEGNGDIGLVPLSKVMTV